MASGWPGPSPRQDPARHRCLLCASVPHVCNKPHQYGLWPYVRPECVEALPQGSPAV